MRGGVCVCGGRGNEPAQLSWTRVSRAHDCGMKSPTANRPSKTCGKGYSRRCSEQTLERCCSRWRLVALLLCQTHRWIHTQRTSVCTRTRKHRRNHTSERYYMETTANKGEGANCTCTQAHENEPQTLRGLGWSQRRIHTCEE